MGLRLRTHFLHDGRAQSAESAVRAHGGEGARTRDVFMTLPESDKAMLLRFLGSL
jgi:CxxC motif-containing protein (DUF1111 family)